MGESSWLNMQSGGLTPEWKRPTNSSAYLHGAGGPASGLGQWISRVPSPSVESALTGGSWSLGLFVKLSPETAVPHPFLPIIEKRTVILRFRGNPP